MKQIVTLLLLSLSVNLSAQSRWLDWQTIYEEGSYPDHISAKLTFNRSGYLGKRLRDYSFIRTNSGFHRDKAWVSFRGDYLNCGSNMQTKSPWIDSSKTGRNDAEQWLLTHQLLRPNNLEYQDYNSKPSGNASHRSSAGSTSANNGINDILVENSQIPKVDGTANMVKTQPRVEGKYVTKANEANNLFR